MPLTHKAADISAESPLIGQRIDRLVQQLCGLSRSQVIGLFDHGCVLRNGATVAQAGERLVAGDHIELRYDAKQRYHPTPKPRKDLGFAIVFEDKHLVVVDKPPELLTVPTRHKETNTLQHKVDAYVRHVAKGRGAFAVHRLDRGVSGLLVFGKTQEIVGQLKDQFAASKPEREYVTIVAGRMKQRQGTFESLLATNKDLTRFSTDDETIGQLAITHFRVVAHLEGATLVQVRLETGRRNQIRVHFAEAGHPVLGDPRYEPELAQHSRWPHKRLALHARLLGFDHPVTGQSLRLESPLPVEMEKFLRARKEGSKDKKGTKGNED